MRISFVGEKILFLPLPRSILAFVQVIDWLIEFLLNILYLFFLPVHWCITAFLCVLYKCRPLCYLIFSKNAEDTFFDPGSRVGRNFFHSSVFVLQVTGAPFPGLCVTEPVFAATAFQRAYLSKVSVDVTLTLVDVYHTFQNILTLTLESVSFRRQNVNVTSTFWKADPGYTFSRRLCVM